MKQFRRVLALLTAALLLAALFGGAALAATKPVPKASSGKIVTLKLKQSVTMPKNENKAPVYKLKINKDSIVTMTWSGNAKKSAYLQFYLDSKCKKNAGYFSFKNKAKGSQKYVFAKGTYYIKMADYTRKTVVKFTAKTIKYTANYTPSKAIALAAGKKLTVGMAPLKDFPLWYKITLTQPQPIAITKSEQGSIWLYDSNLETVSMTYSDSYRASENTLDPGTYYLRVSHDDPYYNVYPPMTFSWN